MPQINNDPVELLDGKYMIIRPLGEGGFGRVVLAQDTLLDQRWVAIKTLHNQDEAHQIGFVREMKVLAHLNHPNIVTFHHHFKDNNGDLCLVMEYCSGGNLRNKLKNKHPLNQIVDWLKQLTSVLHFVHQHGIVHHDIKPENILFDSDNTIKLGDFGVYNTNSGTWPYMAPEPMDTKDARVDVYALGITLLEMWAGYNPFFGIGYRDSLQAKILHDFIPKNLPGWQQEILLKATHPKPELSFQTMADFQEAVEAHHVPFIFDKRQIEAHVLAEKSENMLRRKRWIIALRLAEKALTVQSKCVAALVAAGHCELILKRIDQASQHFHEALRLNPRTDIQKELGWINLELGNYPQAISMLSDHLQRNATDYEAFNLLLQCYYLTDRYETGQQIADLVFSKQSTNVCFENNKFLCAYLDHNYGINEIDIEKIKNPFVKYNWCIVTENPSSWGKNGKNKLKSKLLFQDYRFGFINLLSDKKDDDQTSKRKINIVTINQESFSYSIITIGRLLENHLSFSDNNVSRRHCVIINYPNDVWLYDLGSTTGTYVDGKKLFGKTYLDGVHEIRIGKSQVIKISSKKGLLG